MYLGNASGIDERTKRNLEDFFAYRFTLKTVHSRRDDVLERSAKKIIGGGNQLALLKGRLNPFADVSLIKDPIAIFLAESFADMRGVSTVAMIRHPLSFVGSLKRLKWRFKLAPILEQPRLRSRWAPELDALRGEPQDWITASSWIWTIISRFVLDVARRRPEIVALTQEQLSAEPDPMFRSLFDFFDLPYDDAIARRVALLSSSPGKGDARAEVVHDFRRESAKIFDASIAHLDAEETARVLEICWPTASQIYHEETKPATREDFLRALGPTRLRPAASDAAQ